MIAILKHWKLILAIVLPLAFLPLPLVIGTKAASAGWLVLVMGSFWGLELLPLAGTSLLPIIFYPLMDVLSTDDVCRVYFKGTVMMFFGGLMIAISFEQSNVHKRIAMTVLRLVGISPRLLMLGFMIPTALLSMWISNTATTAMMIPILKSVLLEMEADKKTSIMMFLAVAYAANCGGTGSLIGTGPNLILYETIKECGEDQPIRFLSWIYFAFPLLVINLIIIWLWLQVLCMGLPSKKKSIPQEKKDNITRVLKVKLAELGPVSRYEIVVLCCFLAALGLWFFRDPDFMEGWKTISEVEIDDATPAILISVVLLAVPLPSGEPFLPWKVVQEKMNWNVILIVGGGFALADGMKVSGLNDWIGSLFEPLKDWNQFLFLAIIMVFIMVITQVASNSATASMLLPVLRDLAVSLKINPLLLLLPSCLTCSYAFILPVSTAPNTLVYEALDEMKTFDMMKAGFGLNILTLISTLVYMYTFGNLLYDLNDFPDWCSPASNSTLVMNL